MYSISVDISAGDLSLTFVFNFLSVSLLTTSLTFLAVHSVWWKLLKKDVDGYNNIYYSLCELSVLKLWQ